MDKIIIFGTGKMLSENISRIDLSYVLAFVDNSAPLQCTKIYERMIINPSQIKMYDYDLIVIFNKFNTEDIYNQLVNEFKVPKEKIVSWQYYIYIHNYNVKFLSYNLNNELTDIINSMELNKVLDVDLSLTNMGIYVKNNYQCIIHSLIQSTNECKPIYSNIYDKVENKISALNDDYDALLLLDYFMEHTIDDCIDLIEKTYDKTRYIIITVPYSYPEKYTLWNIFDFSKYGKVRKMMLGIIQILIIDKRYHIKSDNVNIFVVTHKEFQPPQDNIYIPIHAGKRGKQNLGFAGDDTGDNITELNPKINECTALYWMWKNVDCRYIGLNHYRRYLLKNTVWGDMNNILDQQDVVKLMETYDIITSKTCSTYPNTVVDHLKMSVCEEAFEAGYSTVKDVISKRYPEYLNTYVCFFNGYIFYPCNIFITKKEIMNKYCEWLFDILFEVIDQVDTSGYDDYSKRIVGFMAERLFTVWLINNDLKIKELFIINPEKN